jgi:DNA polymerase V
MRAVDALNRRFGRDTVTYAASGIRRAWKLRSAFLSPRYTTSWDELLRV